jgi:hypothetical protein
MTGAKSCLLYTFGAVVALFATAGGAVFAQEVPYVSGREIPEESKFVVLSESMATMIQQKHGLPMLTGRYPLAGLVIFPNQNLAPDLKERLSSKFLGMPVNYTQVVPKFFNSLPPTDLVRIGFPTGRPRDRKKAVGLAARPHRADETAWLIAANDGESFMLPGDPEAVFMTRPGTIFNAAGRCEAALKTGTIWTFTGSRKAAIRTVRGLVEIAPFSIVAVEQSAFGTLRVANLDGGRIKLHHMAASPAREEAIEAGTELVVSDRIVATSGAADYIASSTLPATTPGSVDSSLSKLQPETAPIEQLIRSKPQFSSYGMERRYEKMMARYSASRRPQPQTGAAVPRPRNDSAPGAYAPSMDQRYFVPVQKRPVKVVLPPPITTPRKLQTVVTKRGAFKYLSSSDVSVDNFGRVALKHGELLVNAEENIRINAGSIEVYVSKGAIAVVRFAHDVVSVLNMKEMWKHDVNVVMNGRSMKCSAGHELLIGSSVESVTRAMTEDHLQRRASQVSEFDSGRAAISKSEFSLTGAMNDSPLLRMIYRSTDTSDKKIADAIIKMNACVTLVTGGRGAYNKSPGTGTE